MMTIETLKNRIPQVGTVVQLCIRPAAREPVQLVNSVQMDTEYAIIGDHFAGRAGAKRQVTLIQQEHLEVVAKIVGEKVLLEQVRRNIVVSGINLLALKEIEFKIGDAVLLGTGNCPPCSRMEENLGTGGYNAMRGHGGITASIVRPGAVKVGDSVSVMEKT